MEDEKFIEMLDALKEYLDEDKVFVKNIRRLSEIEHATHIAQKLFADMEITLEDDPLQMGALILCIKGYSVEVCGKENLDLFKELIDKADNFEIYPDGEDKVEFSIVFCGALTRVK